MDELKTLFGENALTFAQFTEAVGNADKKTINLVNLAKGGYVDKGKFDAKAAELSAAQATITDLQDAAKKWDGVDADKLKADMAALQTKYDTDISAAKLDNAVNLALLEAKAKDTKLVKTLLDDSILKLDGDTLMGLTDQLAKVKESHGYLFDAEDTGTGDGQGGARFNTGGGHGSDSKPDFSKMSDDEYYAYIAASKK